VKPRETQLSSYFLNLCLLLSEIPVDWLSFVLESNNNFAILKARNLKRWIQSSHSLTLPSVTCTDTPETKAVPLYTGGHSEDTCMLSGPTMCGYCHRIARSNNSFFFSDVSLTVHLSITLDNDQLNAQIFNTFITILYMYMFRAISCSFLGGQIVLT